MSEIIKIGQMPRFECENRVYSPKGICPSIKIGGDPKKIIEVKQIHYVEVLGGIGEIDFGKQYRQGNRVYNAEKISPALSAQPLGNTAGNSPMFVEVKQATKEGSIKCDIGGGGRFELPKQYNTQRTCARQRADKSNTDNGEYP